MIETKVSLTFDGVLELGYSGENEARQFVFDFSPWLKHFQEGGSVQLLARRPWESTHYPCVLEVADTTATWTVQRADVELAGHGNVVLQYAVGDSVIMSTPFITAIGQGIGAVGGEVPETQEPWVQQVLQASDRAVAAADEAKNRQDKTAELATAVLASETSVKASEAAVEKNRVKVETEAKRVEKAAKDINNIGDMVIGKNLFDVSKITEGLRFDDTGTETAASASTACITDYIPVKYGHTYCWGRTQNGVRTQMGARRVMGYDSEKNLVVVLATTNCTNIQISNESIAYIRCQFNTDQAKTEGSVECGRKVTDYEAYISQYSLVSEKMPLVSRKAFRHDLDAELSVEGSNGFTMVKDQIWTSTARSNTETVLNFYGFDIETGRVWLNGTLSTNFGHLNTVDYSEGNGCLIFGNGGNEYYTDGKFYVIPHATDLYKKSGSATLEDVAIEFDVGQAFGSKLQACWAYDNAGRYDLVCITTNDNANIRILQLGKGASDLGSGILRECDEDEFNGTFKIQQEYALDDGREGEFNADNVNQDCAWYGSNLYIGLSKADGYWRVHFTSDNKAVCGEAKFEEFLRASYTADGELRKQRTQGIHVTQDHVILETIETIGSAKRLLRFYKR